MTTFKISAEANSTKLEVKKVQYKVSIARTGGQGADNSSLGGLQVAPITDPQEGDLLGLSNNTWVNIRRSSITDGGNF
jgi:hypothetical protein